MQITPKVIKGLLIKIFHNGAMMYNKGNNRGKFVALAPVRRAAESNAIAAFHQELFLMALHANKIAERK